MRRADEQWALTNEDWLLPSLLPACPPACLPACKPLFSSKRRQHGVQARIPLIPERPRRCGERTCGRTAPAVKRRTTSSSDFLQVRRAHKNATRSVTLQQSG